MMLFEHPSQKTWRYSGSEYIVTKEKGNFTQMTAACAALGMHLWYPNSNEEMRFVEREIYCYLSEEYYKIPSWGNNLVTYDIWIGVNDRPNGNCLLADGVTRCPVENYFPGEPSTAAEDCTVIWYIYGKFSWADTRSVNSRDFYSLCEKEV